MARKADGTLYAGEQDFVALVSEVKEEIRSARLRASVRVNSELIRLYWRLGMHIAREQERHSWGDGFLKALSTELTRAFPEMKGLSYTNLRYVKQWYSFYSSAICQQLVGKLGETFFEVPWGHHLYILSRCKEAARAAFYLQKTVENGWSRAVLLNFLDTDLYEREGRAVSNFAARLPEGESDLAQEMTRDPYAFDFLSLTGSIRERELEDALTKNITRFLLELGHGFAYVGRQVELTVGEDVIRPDLLFYHLRLRCYVVVELKVTCFEPGFVGQLGTYVAAVNHQLRRDGDAETLGLLICKSKNDVLAQYALESVKAPIGISAYELAKVYTDAASSLPSVEEIELEVRRLNDRD